MQLFSNKVIKKYGVTLLVIIASTIAFITAYRLTNSWKLSLVIAGIPVVYIIVTIGEFIESIKSSKEQSEKEFRSIKNQYLKETKDNPTLR